jgi:signal transduction histidine kinase
VPAAINPQHGHPWLEATMKRRRGWGYRSGMTRDDRAELREVSAAVLDVTAHRSVREVLNTILTAARRLLDAQYAALGIPDAKGSFAEFLAVGLTDAQWRAIGPVPRQHGLLGLMLCDPRPVRLADVRRHRQFGGWPGAHPTLTDFLGIPIVAGDQILGELFLANKRTPGGFTADDEELGRLLAGHAAIALVNARLYERNRELSIVEERNRIARELHDAVTQKLFSLRLTAEAAGALLPADPVRAADEVATVRRLAGDVADELRAVVVGLVPPDLSGDGLGSALRKQAELLDRVHDAAVRFDGDPVPRLGPEREEAAYRIAQEALHNALRHGRPTTVTVGLRAMDRTVALSVHDDGNGFDPAARESTGRRLGIASMRERARAVGGRLEVESRPGAGTTVRLVFGPPAGRPGNG